MPIVTPLSETPLAMDNDVFSDLRKGAPPTLEKVRGHFEATAQFPALTAITLLEARYGIESELAKSNITEEQARTFHQRINELASVHRVLDFNDRASALAAHILARIGVSNGNKHWYDIMIASTAVAHGFGVASGNTKDFELIARYLPSNNNQLQLAKWR